MEKYSEKFEKYEDIEGAKKNFILSFKKITSKKAVLDKPAGLAIVIFAKPTTEKLKIEYKEDGFKISGFSTTCEVIGFGDLRRQALLTAEIKETTSKILKSLSNKVKIL